MAIDKSIKIEKLNLDTEEWIYFCSKHAEINKSSGKEYFNANTHITENTFNFKIRYTNKLEDILFNFTQYRIIYKNRKYVLKNADDYKLKHINLILVAECIGI